MIVIAFTFALWCALVLAGLLVRRQGGRGRLTSARKLSTLESSHHLLLGGIGASVLVILIHFTLSDADGTDPMPWLCSGILFVTAIAMRIVAASGVLQLAVADENDMGVVAEKLELIDQHMVANMSELARSARDISDQFAHFRIVSDLNKTEPFDAMFEVFTEIKASLKAQSERVLEVRIDPAQLRTLQRPVAPESMKLDQGQFHILLKILSDVKDGVQYSEKTWNKVSDTLDKFSVELRKSRDGAKTVVEMPMAKEFTEAVVEWKSYLSKAAERDAVFQKGLLSVMARQEDMKGESQGWREVYQQLYPQLAQMLTHAGDLLEEWRVGQSLPSTAAASATASAAASSAVASAAMAQMASSAMAQMASSAVVSAAAGSQAAGSQATGSQAASSQAAGSQAAGSQAAISQAAISQAAGTQSANGGGSVGGVVTTVTFEYAAAQHNLMSDEPAVVQKDVRDQVRVVKFRPAIALIKEVWDGYRMLAQAASLIQQQCMLISNGLRAPKMEDVEDDNVSPSTSVYYAKEIRALAKAVVLSKELTSLEEHQAALEKLLRMIWDSDFHAERILRRPDCDMFLVSPGFVMATSQAVENVWLQSSVPARLAMTLLPLRKQVTLLVRTLMEMSQEVFAFYSEEPPYADETLGMMLAPKLHRMQDIVVALNTATEAFQDLRTEQTELLKLTFAKADWKAKRNKLPPVTKRAS